MEALQIGKLMRLEQLLNHPDKENVLFDLQYDIPSPTGDSYWKILNGTVVYGDRWASGMNLIEATQMLLEGMNWTIRIVAIEKDASKEWSDEVTKRLRERVKQTNYWSPEED